MRKIAIVEENPDQQTQMVRLLGTLGECFTLADSRAMLSALHRETFDLACIDWTLPDLSGTELIARIRAGVQAPRMPIILVTSRVEEQDIVTGLRSGADDFVSKPLNEQIFLARVNTLFRRCAPNADEKIELYGKYTFDRLNNLVTTPESEILLTSKEFNLALEMFRNLGRPLGRNYLTEMVWGMPNTNSRTLDMHISRLKKKLSLVPENGYIISPIYGFGYRLDHSFRPNSQG